LEGTRIDKVALGGYVLNPEVIAPQVTLIGTGSEVALCVDAATALHDRGIVARVVSMPSLGRFLASAKTYQDEVIPRDLPSVSIEAGSTFGWAGVATQNIGIDRFGLSAPAPEVFDALGITTAAIVECALNLVGGNQ
jgi:transketolase